MIETKRGKSTTFIRARQLQLWRERERERDMYMIKKITSKHLIPTYLGNIQYDNIIRKLHQRYNYLE